MDEIRLRAHAKINMSLEITGKRSDGYHDILSLMQGVGLHDVIKITKCPQNGTKYNLPHCTIDGVVVYLCTDAKTIPVDSGNLAFKGIKAVLSHCGDELRAAAGEALIVDIEKKLPVAAGIAGGSGNAATCMLGLDAMLGFPFSLRELMVMGTDAGADVPFSLMMNARLNAGTLAGLAGLGEASAAAWVSGIGDIVRPVEPMSRRVILANPGISVSTAAAYTAIDDILEAAGRSDTPAADEGRPFVNDLEGYTLRDYPEAAELMDIMRTALRADNVLMTGSGPTIVAYYEDSGTAESDFEKIRKMLGGRPGHRCWLTTTGRAEEILADAE